MSGLQHPTAAPSWPPHGPSFNGRGFISGHSWPCALFCCLREILGRHWIVRAKKTRTFSGYGWNSSPSTSCLWGLWKAGSDHRGWRRVSIPQPALSRHLSGMTSGLALLGQKLPGEQSHMMTTSDPPCLLQHAASVTSVSAQNYAWGAPISQTRPIKVQGNARVVQLRRGRTRTWTQATLLQGPSLPPHCSHGAYRTWIKHFQTLFQNQELALNMIGSIPSASHSMLIF